MKKHAVMIEKASDGGLGVYAPDLPGCVGMGYSREEALQNMVEAIPFPLEGLLEEGFPPPEPASEAEI